MTTDTYAAPEANLSLNSSNIETLLEPLRSTRPWVRLCSVMGFIGVAFTVLGAMGLMVGMSSAMSASGMGAGMGIGMGVAYLVMAVLMFFPSYYLHKYAGAITQLETTLASEDLYVALRYQKSFWKFVGIVMLVYLVLIGLTLVFGMIAGFAAAM